MALHPTVLSSRLGQRPPTAPGTAAPVPVLRRVGAPAQRELPLRPAR